MPTAAPAPSETARAVSTIGISAENQGKLERGGVITDRENKIIKRLEDLRAEKGDKATIIAMREQQERSSIPQETVNEAIKAATKETGGEKIADPRNPRKEITRSDLATETGLALNKFTKEGFASLEPTQQELITNWVYKEMIRWPAYKAIFDKARARDPYLEGVIKKQAVESILNHPDFSGNIQEGLAKLMEKGMPNVVAEAELQHQKIIDQKNASESKREALGGKVGSEAGGELKAVQDTLSSYNDGLSGESKGSKYLRLDQLNNAIANAEKTLSTDQDDVRFKKERWIAANANLNRLKHDDPTIEQVRAELSRTKEEYDIANAKILLHQANKDERTKLENDIKEFNANRREKLQKRQGEIKSELGDLDGQISTLTKEGQNAEGELETAKTKQKALEREFQDALTSTVAKSTLDVLANQLEESDRLDDVRATREVEEAKGDATKAVSRAILEMWRQKETKGKWLGGLVGKREVTAFKKEDLIKSLRTLVDKGPEALMRQVLENAKKLDPPMNLDAEVIEKTINDPEFMAEKGPELSLALLKQVRRSGQRIEPEDFEFIVTTPWGKDLVDKFIETDPDIEAKLKQAKAAGLVPDRINPKDLPGYILKNKGKIAASSLLTFLLMGIVGGIVAPAAVAIGSGLVVAKVAGSAGKP